MTRTLAQALPWLILLIISATSAYGMNSVVSGPPTDALAIATQTCDPTSARLARYAVSNGWMPTQFAVGCR